MQKRFSTAVPVAAAVVVLATVTLNTPATAQSPRGKQAENLQAEPSAGALPQPGQAQQPDDAFEQWVGAYAKRLPGSADDCTLARAAECAEAARAIDLHAATLSEIPQSVSPEDSIIHAARLMKASAQVAKLADKTLQLRTQFADLPEGPQRREALRALLEITNGAFDLSGRLSFHVEAATYESAYRVASNAVLRQQLIDAAASFKDPIGTEVMCWAMIDPPPNSPNGAIPADAKTKSELIEIAANSGHLGTLPILAQFVRVPGQSSTLLVEAAAGIRKLGLPQDPRPGQANNLPPAEITAAELTALLSRINGAELDQAHKTLRNELIVWLGGRISKGVSEDEFPMGGFSVRPGDWMLMRNPSPYNLFTDLSPGLFTHVGIVTTETGADGKRRFVLVDLPERGTSIPATNVETFVKRSRHYVFVRSNDADAAETIAGVAREIIGNESVFDLKFRTAGALSLKGKPKAGEKIETYCAGLLLLAAQETEYERSEFFPIPETIAGGRTAENLNSVGLSFGDDFISPTGALFSPLMEVVGRRAPMYDPTREIEEAVYDHFAERLRAKVLSPEPSMFQNVRTTLAAAAEENAALARLLAQLSDVNPDMDLQAAANAAVVIEALDDAAYGASADYLNAFFAVTAPSAQVLQQRGVSREEIQVIETRRGIHRDLARRFSASELSDRQLREALIRHYVDRGKSEIDEMFEAGQ